jgi:hypothetical protein
MIIMAMADEEIVALLREIRDLQRLHVENYKDALQNQQISIDMQSNALRRQRRSLATLLIVVILGVVLAVLPSMLVHH